MIDKINILIIGNTASAGWNLKKGFLKKYPDVKVHVVFEESPVLSGVPDKELYKPKEYDFVIYSYPFIKTWIKYNKYIRNAKVLICYWRGTDLRLKDFKNPFVEFFYKSAQMFLKEHLFKTADYHLYSTIDLAWWLRSVPEHKKTQFNTPIDTDLFYPMVNFSSRQELINFKDGARGYNKLKITHDQMPVFLNKYKFAMCKPAFGLSDKLISCTIRECLACGLIVKGHEYKNRDWVIKTAGLKTSTIKIYKLCKELIGVKYGYK